MINSLHPTRSTSLSQFVVERLSFEAHESLAKYIVRTIDLDVHGHLVRYSMVQTNFMLQTNNTTVYVWFFES